MTSIGITPPSPRYVEAPIYEPQADTELLVAAALQLGCLPSRRVVDLCTGSGAVAVAAAAAGAKSVAAFDLSPSAVDGARDLARAAGQRVSVHLGSWSCALQHGPFDVVLCNPPYVPIVPTAQPVKVGALPPRLAYDGGVDGRSVLDPLCATMSSLLTNGGVALIVQSELADVPATIAALDGAGMRAEVHRRRTIPFGPVLQMHAASLEASGRIGRGQRVETIAVIAGFKP